MERKRIVVIGGGFAGLNFTKKIDKDRFEVVIVDKNNFHSFPPLFYQVASSGLDPESICFPFRREMRRGRTKGSSFHLGEVKYINTTRKEVVTQFESIPYDILVIAAGSTNNYFSTPELEKYVFTLKSTAQALRIRNEVLDRLERASICRNAEERKKLLNFTVIGGGPAGVEIAGAIGEMKKYILKREYPGISRSDMKIILIEGSDAVLGAMSKKCQQKAMQYLNELMVDVRLGTMMESYRDNVLSLSSGEQIPTSVVIWTAGVAAVQFRTDAEPLPLGAGRRIKVDRLNRVAGFSDIYALGDVCIIEDELTPRGDPQLAQVALQQGENLANNLNKGAEVPFRYNDKGSMATVGKNRAVAQLRGGATLTGWLAWMVWMFVHLLSILGMRNKVAVLVNWTWSYFTYATSLRVLIHTSRYPLRQRWGER